MRGKAGLSVANRLASLIGWGGASILFGALCGCSWNDVLPAHPTTISNAEAVDRALQRCSLSAGEQPFHLVLEVSPPSDTHEPVFRDMQAQIEVFWLNPITYRTVIRSPKFSQIRVTNGRVLEEHNTGDFYPRWIENFVEAILDPMPGAGSLRKVPGSMPIGVEEHACIDSGSAQVCFQDAEPRIATGSDPSRSFWFDNYAPFGQQQIARTLVDKLPANLLVRGHILLLAPLDPADYPLLKAREFTQAAKLIQTEFVSQSAAESLMLIAPANFGDKPHIGPYIQHQARLVAGTSAAPGNVSESPAVVLIRTDRTGKVREAYDERSGEATAQNSAIVRAMALKFKPLVVDGVPRQMEAAISVP